MNLSVIDDDKCVSNVHIAFWSGILHRNLRLFISLGFRYINYHTFCECRARRFLYFDLAYL